METPKMGAKTRRMCDQCGETTTHRYGRITDDDEPRWLCFMHDLNPRSPAQLARIRANRSKPWGSH